MADLTGPKADNGKTRWSLIPWDAMEEVVGAYEVGAKKYEIDSWKQGISFSRLFSAALRHLFAYWLGERRCIKDGQHHLGAVIFCCLTMLWSEKNRPDCDDRLIDRSQEKTGRYSVTCRNVGCWRSDWGQVQNSLEGLPLDWMVTIYDREKNLSRIAPVSFWVKADGINA